MKLALTFYDNTYSRIAIIAASFISVCKFEQAVSKGTVKPFSW